MYFTHEQAEELTRAHSEVHDKFADIRNRYISRNYANARAEEYATHGFARRLGIVVRCIDNVFEILPPDLEAIPSRDAVADATINVQAFVFNVFGSIDNLAWIWVEEKAVRNEDGSPIPNKWIGLGEKNTFVRGTFSAEFQEYLTKLNPWFSQLHDYRHALAHRIPLYIPPYTVTPANLAAHQQLEDRMTEAIKQSNFADYERLSSEQEALGSFKPWMTHSFEEGTTPVVFHYQMLADFNTIEELAKKMLKELDA